MVLVVKNGGTGGGFPEGFTALGSGNSGAGFCWGRAGKIFLDQKKFQEKILLEIAEFFC